MKKKITMQNTSCETIKEAADAFILRCESRNLSQATILDYKTKLKPFIQEYGKCAVKSITQEMIEAYILSLKKEHNQNAISVQSYARSLRAFCYWCMENHMMQSFKITLPKSDETLKDLYTDAEIDALLKKPDRQKCSFAEFRAWTIINFLCGTGCRIGTALSVRIGDIDFISGVINFRKTKSRKLIVCPLSKTLASVLLEYLDVRGNEPDDFLFCDQYGQQATVNAVQLAVVKYNRQRGVQKTSLHLFRHCFAKNWILSGGDLFRLQKILGHSDITMTRRYLDLFDGDLKQGFDNFNILDQRSRTKKISMR